MLGLQHKTCWTCCRCGSGVKTLEQSSLLLCYILCWLDSVGSSAQRRVGRAISLGDEWEHWSSPHCCCAIYYVGWTVLGLRRKGVIDVSTKAAGVVRKCHHHTVPQFMSGGLFFRTERSVL